MKKSWILALFAVSMFLVGVSASHAAEQVKLKFAAFWPPTHKICGLNQQYCDEMKKRTNGRVEITHYAGGTLAPAPKVFNSVLEGIADIGLAAVPLTRGRFPLAEAFDSPLGFPGAWVASHVANDSLEKFKPKEWDKVHVLNLMCVGPAIPHTLTKQVKTMQDLRGLKVRSVGRQADMVNAYAAAAGLPCRVAMPEDTPQTIFDRCRLHGAEVLSSPGTLVDAGKLLAQRQDGFWTLATLREPYRVEGKKTMLYEIAEQMGWRLPDWVIYPTGGGTGIVGMRKAYDEMLSLGLVNDPLPRFVVAQMRGCAPIVRAFEQGARHAEPWVDAQTRVWGLRVPSAIADFLILDAVRESGGTAIALDEAAIEGTVARAAREEGMLIGPEGAAALLALETLVADGTIKAGQSVVVFQTGHPANYA